MLHHTDHGGDGPPLVLLHAFPLDSAMYDRLVPLLAAEARVITVDLPGLGRSPVPTGAPSMASVAEQVLEVLDASGVGSAYVFGISTGGYVALEVAASTPGRLRGLGLGSTTTHRTAPDIPGERREVADEVERLGSTEPLAGSAEEGLGATAKREQPALAPFLRDVIGRTDPSGAAWMARAIAGRDDTTEALRAYDGPVLLVFGEEDVATPPSRGEEMLEVRAGDAHLAVLPRTGHLTALEAPELVAAHLVELLRR